MATLACEFEDIGPIVEEFRFVLPQEGGLVVLQGENGCGKTHILHTVEFAQTGNGKLSKRDGAKEGRASVLGRELTVKKKTIQKGDLEIDGVGDLDLSTLHTPKLKTPAGRDKTRIATLVRLAGVEPDISLFYDIVGDREEFDRSVGESARETNDLVDMAARVKRDLETVSRAHEDRAKTAAANARAKQDAIEGVDFDQPHDEDRLNAELEAAIETQARLRQRKENASTTATRVVQARERLREAEERYTGPAAAAAKRDALAKHEQWHEQEAEADRLRDALAKAEQAAERAHQEAEAADNVLMSAMEHESSIAAWKQTIDESVIDPPREEELDESTATVAKCRKAVEDGVRIRDAIKAKSEADEQKAREKQEARRAEEFRDAAKETASVLSHAVEQIPDCPLRIAIDDDGDCRLVIEHPRGPLTRFDELSDGERWSVIVPLALAQNRLVVLPQAAFGELQPAKRKLLHDLARKAGGWILSAEATDGPLEARVYGEEMAVTA